jgi:hypothetical protein
MQQPRSHLAVERALLDGVADHTATMAGRETESHAISSYRQERSRCSSTMKKRCMV